MIATATNKLKPSGFILIFESIKVKYFSVMDGVEMAVGAFSKSWLEKYARQELGGLIEAAVDRAVSLNSIALPVRTMSTNKHT